MNPRRIQSNHVALGLLVAMVATGEAWSQEVAPQPVQAPIESAPAVSVLPSDVQIVKFTAPNGTKLELLGPTPEAIVSATDSKDSPLVGMKVGVGYRLKLSNLPTAPAGSVLYPVVEVVGHLHRPPGIDPGKYPIRIEFTGEDFEDAVTRGFLVTKVIYLEEPEQALPVAMQRDHTPIVSLSPAENPLKVAPALGRVMAIVRIGGREPTAQELAGEPEWPLGSMPCPFSCSDKKCDVPCGPVCGTPPAQGRIWLPRDEFLCDGGDHTSPARFSGNGGLAGIDPRDAVIRFTADDRTRILPTNMVCLYAPRFAAVRGTVGASQALYVDYVREADKIENQITYQAKQYARKMTQNQTAEIARHRSRVSGLNGRVYAGEHAEIRVLHGYDVPTNIAGHITSQPPVIATQRDKFATFRFAIKGEGIKTAESAVVRGVIVGAGEKVMAWKASDVTGVEVPPNKPGLAVVKQVNATEAEPGDVVTFTIRYRNIGNVPIREASVLDSLLPRLEYLPGSSLGPAGTVFTAVENNVGSMELRWDLPGVIAPGQEGYVEFKVRVR